MKKLIKLLSAMGLMAMALILGGCTSAQIGHFLYDDHYCEPDIIIVDNPYPPLCYPPPVNDPPIVVQKRPPRNQPLDRNKAPSTTRTKATERPSRNDKPVVVRRGNKSDRTSRSR